MRSIAISNLKGGVGKTVTTISLAHILAAEYGKRVLMVDCDGQCNLTRFFCPDLPEDTLTVAEVLEGTGEVLWSDNVTEAGPGLLLLPASSGLYRLDIAAITRGGASLGGLRQFVEAAAEDEGAEVGVDVVLFDCPPGFTAASSAALLAAEEVILPVLADGFSLEGMVDMARQIQSLRQVNPRLRVTGVLLNQWRRCPVVEQGEALLRRMGLPVFETVIRRSEKVPESTIDKTALPSYSPTSSAGRDFRALAREIFGEVRDRGEI